MPGITNSLTILGLVALLIALGFRFTKKGDTSFIDGLVKLFGIIAFVGLIAGVYDFRTVIPDAAPFLDSLGAYPITSISFGQPSQQPSQNTNVPSTVIDTSTKPVSTLQIKGREKYSLLDNVVNGSFGIFNPSVNPSSVSTTSIQSISLTNGVGSTTSASASTNTNYIFVYDGVGRWYDENYGIMQFSNANYADGKVFYNLPDVVRIGNFSVPVNVSAGNAAINGQSTHRNQDEINISSSVVSTGSNDITYGTLVYNTTTGDGTFFIDLLFSNDVVNSEIRDAVLCFENDGSNPMSGNEVTGINFQSLSGQAFPGSPQLAGLHTYITADACTNLGNLLSGFRSSYRLAFTVNDANWDSSNGRFNIWVDDLGLFKEKDVRNNFGVRGYRLQIRRSS